MGKPTVADRGRTVDCIVRMGFNKNMATFLNKAKVDLSKIEALEIKNQGYSRVVHKQVFDVYVHIK